MSRACLWGLALASLAGLRGQTISVETREVVVEVSVVDPSGTPVSGLKKEDFTLKDEGKFRPFDFSIATHYEPISGRPETLHAPPRTVGGPVTAIGHSTAIIMDTVNAFADDAGVMHGQVNSLLSKAPPDERIAIYVIARRRGLLLLQDYTEDRDLLRRSLAAYTMGGMRPAPPGRFFFDQPIPPHPVKPMTDVDMLEMWRENSEEARLSLQTLAGQLMPIPGRKSLFWVTTGFHPWILGLGTPPSPLSALHSLSMFKPSWEKTFSDLNQANAAVNVVDARGVYGASNPNTGTIAGMREIADKTGGKAYYGRNYLDDAIVEGIQASRAAYTLRFQLTDEERDQRFHELKVAVNRPKAQLFYRQGYFAGGTQRPADLVAGKVEGKALEARAGAAPPLDASIQLPWFYTETNRARVHLAVAMKPEPREPIEIVGVTLRPDGTEVSRFADRIHAGDGGRYEHPFTLAAGTYTFRLTVGSGAAVLGTKEVPLQIDHRDAGTFALGGIVLARDVRPVAAGPPPIGALIVGGKEFIPAADTRFGKAEPVQFYSEIYESANAAPLTVRYRVFDAGGVEARFDSGLAEFAQSGKTLIPFAASLPVSQLAAGKYRLEVSVGHKSSEALVTRAVAFEVNQ